MKKVMFAAALVAVGTAMADVTSANIVGYHQITIHNGFNMFGINFDDVADSEKGIDIQDLFPGTMEGLKPGASAGLADCIKVLKEDGVNYDTFFLYKKASGSDAKDYKWCYTQGLMTKVATKEFKSGDAFWYKAIACETPVNVNVSGAVCPLSTQPITIKQGFNMIASKFPVNFNPNSYDAAFWADLVSKGATAGASAGLADVIKIIQDDGVNYTTYFLYKKASGSDAKDYRWCYTQGLMTKVLDASADCIKAGHGVWYKHYGATTFTLDISTPIGK